MSALEKKKKSTYVLNGILWSSNITLKTKTTIYRTIEETMDLSNGKGKYSTNHPTRCSRENPIGT